MCWKILFGERADEEISVTSRSDSGYVPLKFLVTIVLQVTALFRVLHVVALQMTSETLHLDILRWYRRAENIFVIPLVLLARHEE